MLIEQITEFELRGLVPRGRTSYTATTSYFHDKTKIAWKILRWNII